MIKAVKSWTLGVAPRKIRNNTQGNQKLFVSLLELKKLIAFVLEVLLTIDWSFRWQLMSDWNIEIEVLQQRRLKHEQIAFCQHFADAATFTQCERKVFFWNR